jgi:hypothetical protein
MCRVALLESFAARVIRSRRDLVQASVILQIRDPSGNAAAPLLCCSVAFRSPASRASVAMGAVTVARTLGTLGTIEMAK